MVLEVPDEPAAAADDARLPAGQYGDAVFARRRVDRRDGPLTFCSTRHTSADADEPSGPAPSSISAAARPRSGFLTDDSLHGVCSFDWFADASDPAELAPPPGTPDRRGPGPSVGVRWKRGPALHLGDGRVPRRRPRCRSAPRARHRGRAARTCCCCSSTRPSTRSAAAPSPATCRSARTWYARAGIDVVKHRPRRQADLPRSGPARRLPDHARRRRRLPTCARWSRRSPPRSPRRGSGRAGATARGRYTGVWVEDRKIALDRRPRLRGVSAHGFAINVDNDVEPFD